MTHKWSQLMKIIPEFHFYNNRPYSMNFTRMKLQINYNRDRTGRNTTNQSFIKISS
jgi:hypothetical protein